GVAARGITGTPVALPDGFQLIDGYLYRDVNGYLVGPNADLSGADLSNADLSNAYLYGVDLSNANLSGADLSGADISNVDLSDANLSNANLSGADLYGVDLSNADLSGANLSGVAAWGITGTPVALPDGFQIIIGNPITWDDGFQIIEEINSLLVGPNADLSGAYLSNVDLSGINLSGASLYRANLSDANLSGANLSGANLSNAVLYGADLSGSNLSDAKLISVETSDATAFNGANLVNAISNDVALAAVIDIQNRINSNTERINQMESQLAILINSLAQKDAVIEEKNERIALLEDAGVSGVSRILLDEKDAQLAQMTTERDTAITQRDARPTQEVYNAVIAQRDARFTADQMQGLAAGKPVLEKNNGSFKLRFQVKTSADLESFTTMQMEEVSAVLNEVTDELELEFTPTNKVAFYQLKFSE
ncbi:pentapeptide repeat-containing protein, partial [bacterium]|nr:pentapeptide repeat-containing protein [bacterium]